MLYRLIRSPYSPDAITHVERVADSVFIPFDPANTDYQQFKADILDGDGQLENADGVLMSPEEAKAFVETLP